MKRNTTEHELKKLDFVELLKLNKIEFLKLQEENYI